MLSLISIASFKKSLQVPRILKSRSIINPNQFTTMSPPRRAIITVTSATAPLHHGHPTGLFISEALHPFNVFKEAGFEVDLVSETGKYTPDWLSQQPDFLNGKDLEQWNDLNGEFRKKVDNLNTPEQIDASKVSANGSRESHERPL